MEEEMRGVFPLGWYVIAGLLGWAAIIAALMWVFPGQITP
jgi:hypothetical protein